MNDASREAFEEWMAKMNCPLTGETIIMRSVGLEAHNFWMVWQAAQEQAKQEPVLLNKMKSPNIDEIVSHFLSWKLPTDFSPDGGISFETRYLPSSPHWVIGTNLFTADQAKAMFEHVLKGSHSELVPSPPNQAKLIAELEEKIRQAVSLIAQLNLIVIAGELSSADTDKNQLYCEISKSKIKSARKAIDQALAKIKDK